MFTYSHRTDSGIAAEENGNMTSSIRSSLSVRGRMRILVLSVLLFCLSLPLSAAVVGEENFLTVKIFPDLESKFGFSDKTPSHGTDYLEPFSLGRLRMDDKGHLLGRYYLYCLVNGLKKKYTITVSATAMQAYLNDVPVSDPNVPYLGYQMKIGSAKANVYPVYCRGSLGVPAEAGTFLLEFYNGSEYQKVFLSDETVAFHNIWYRSIDIDADAHTMMELMTKYIWKATVTATFVGQ